MLAIISGVQANIITAALSFLSICVPALAGMWWKVRSAQIRETRVVRETQSRELRKVAELEAARAAAELNKDLVLLPTAYRELLDEIREERATMRDELKRSADQIDLLIEQLSDAQHELANTQASLLAERAEHSHTRDDLAVARRNIRELEHELRGAAKRRTDIIGRINVRSAGAPDEQIPVIGGE